MDKYKRDFEILKLALCGDKCIDVTFVQDREDVIDVDGHLLVPESLRIYMVTNALTDPQMSPELALIAAGDSERLWSAYAFIDETRHEIEEWRQETHWVRTLDNPRLVGENDETGHSIWEANYDIKEKRQQIKKLKHEIDKLKVELNERRHEDEKGRRETRRKIEEKRREIEERRHDIEAMQKDIQGWKEEIDGRRHEMGDNIRKLDQRRHEMEQTRLRRRLRFNAVFLNTHPKCHFGWRWRSLAWRLLDQKYTETDSPSCIVPFEGENESLWDVIIEHKFIVSHLHRKPLNSGALEHLASCLDSEGLLDAFLIASKTCTLFPSSSYVFVLTCECLQSLLHQEGRSAGSEEAKQISNIVKFWRETDFEDWPRRQKIFEEATMGFEMDSSSSDLQSEEGDAPDETDKRSDT